MKPGSLRRCTSLLLVVSLSAPGPGFAQIPSPSPPLPPPTGTQRPVAPPPVAPPPPLVTPPAQRAPATPPAPTGLPSAATAPRGLTPGPDYLLEAHRRVSERARGVFKFADATITVVAPRTFEVIVSGEVERPGTVQTTAMRRVYDIIQDAGGITARGSTRSIVLMRRSGDRQADLLAFRLRGDVAQN